MVGAHALRSALEDAAVDEVTSIGRRLLDVSHPKLKQMAHADFSDCQPLAAALVGQDAVVYCLGTYTGVVPDDELKKITLDYTEAFARVLRVSSPRAAFSFLSGNGADPTGKSRMAYARYKGAAEKALLESGFPRVYLFRPAYIYPVEPRKEPNFSYRLLRAVYPAFRVVFPNEVIRSDELARAMVDAALHGVPDGLGPVLENRDIRAMAAARQRGRSAPAGTLGASRKRGAT